MENWAEFTISFPVILCEQSLNYTFVHVLLVQVLSDTWFNLRYGINTLHYSSNIVSVNLSQELLLWWSRTFNCGYQNRDKLKKEKKTWWVCVGNWSKLGLTQYNCFLIFWGGWGGLGFTAERKTRNRTRFRKVCTLYQRASWLNLFIITLFVSSF